MPAFVGIVKYFILFQTTNELDSFQGSQHPYGQSKISISSYAWQCNASSKGFYIGKIQIKHKCIPFTSNCLLMTVILIVLCIFMTDKCKMLIKMFGS